MKAIESPAAGLLLSRCVLSDSESMPVEVARWLADHAHLPAEDQTRVRELYEKQIEEVISDSEREELDDYTEVIATIDILRARAKSIVRKAA